MHPPKKKKEKTSVSRVSSRVLRHAQQSPRKVVVAFGGFLLHWWPPQPAERSSFSTVFFLQTGVVDENPGCLRIKGQGLLQIMYDVNGGNKFAEVFFL